MQENNQTNDTSNNTPNPTPNSSSNEVVHSATVAPAASASESVVDVAHTDVANVVTTADTVAATAVDSVTASTPEIIAPEAVAPIVSGLKKQTLIQYGIATLVVLIMGAGLAYALEQQGRINTGIFTKVSSLINPAPLAAKVNGAKITMADYEKNINQLKTAATQQGADISNESILAGVKKQAIDVLVNTELLRQEARKSGANVTPEQIETRYQEIVKSLGDEEKLKAKMTELGITEAGLRTDIEGEILIQGHLSSAVDTSKIAITDEELKASYDQISAGAAGKDVPPLAEIKTQLEAQLKTNKEQELVNAYITKLREAAKIEVLI